MFTDALLILQPQLVSAEREGLLAIVSKTASKPAPPQRASDEALDAVDPLARQAVLLQRLDVLRRTEVLTDEEYERQRKKNLAEKP